VCCESLPFAGSVGEASEGQNTGTSHAKSMNNEKAKIQNFEEKKHEATSRTRVYAGALSTWGKTLEKMGSISPCFSMFFFEIQVEYPTASEIWRFNEESTM
jgi:hypothetical protein